jgi:hypothetical protein
MSFSFFLKRPQRRCLLCSTSWRVPRDRIWGQKEGIQESRLTKASTKNIHLLRLFFRLVGFRHIANTLESHKKSAVSQFVAHGKN